MRRRRKSLNKEPITIVFSGEALEMLIHWRHLTGYEVAQVTGLSEQYIGQLIYEHKTPSTATLGKLNKVLNCYFYLSA